MYQQNVTIVGGAVAEMSEVSLACGKVYPCNCMRMRLVVKSSRSTFATEVATSNECIWPILLLFRN